MTEIAHWLSPTAAVIYGWWLVVWASVAFLLVLSGLVFIRPAMVHRLIVGFVAAQRIDFLELAIRLIVSLAFVAVSPATKVPHIFFWSGAGLAISALPLMLLHRLQRRYAAIAIPMHVRLLPVMGILAIALGGFIVWAIV